MHNQEVPLKILDDMEINNITISDWNAGAFTMPITTGNITDVVYYVTENYTLTN